MSDDADKVGAENAKVSDTDIQGAKAGKRNRAETEAGVKPVQAGEVRTDDQGLPDPASRVGNE